MSVRRTQILTGTTTLTAAMGKMHFLDPGGASREVLLPPMKAGLVLFVKNTADMAEDLTLKDVETGLVTVATLDADDTALLFTDGVSWGVVRPSDIEAGEIVAAMLGAGSVTTAKILAANVTPPKLDFTGLKPGVFDGRNGAGACTLVGAAVGDRVVCGWLSGDVSDRNTKGQGVVTVRSAFVALFETAITVADQIQQASATDLSDNVYTVWLAPAAA